MKEKRWRMGPFGSQRLCLGTRNGVMYHGYPLMDILGMTPSMVEECSIRARSVPTKNSNSLDHVFNRGWQGKRWLFSGSSLKTTQSKNKLKLSGMSISGNILGLQIYHTCQNKCSHIWMCMAYMCVYIYLYIDTCVWQSLIQVRHIWIHCGVPFQLT